jgi:hypothetical protein
MTTLEATTTYGDGRSVTDYPVRTDADGTQIVASLICWHDKDRKALLGQLRGVTIGPSDTDGVEVREFTPSRSIMITTRGMNRFSQSTLEGFTLSAMDSVDMLRNDTNEDDSYVMGVKSIFSGEF